MASSTSSNHSATSIDLADKPPGVSASILVLGFTLLVAWFYAIPLRDEIFAICYSCYIVSVDVVRFDRNRPYRAAGLPHTRLLRDPMPGFIKYLLFLALVCPVCLLLFARHKNAAQVAAPHLFLLLAQIFMENATSFLECHQYVKCLVPIGFNAYREASLLEWVQGAYYNLMIQGGNDILTLRRVSLVLAVLNLIGWTYNLFGFLLLRVMPSYIDSERRL